ncbi:serum response factor-binding protein 1-like isoform X2 [Gymnodraco acuticeps]|uniref:Serum response factor-binding protein 1-like isoform X2 n=1 Tax=Gymnodraco acuticeps TaxID=8218 RepID=A0A6P8W5E6_GYMAC|nr:serum response factor-binding protein 1-like isoform X2 [Gymnodraco acuticeps]
MSQRLQNDNSLAAALMQQARAATNAQVPLDLSSDARPAPESPAPERPAPERPAPERPATERPAPESPAPKRPAPERPAPERPATERPAPERPAPERPATERPAPESPAPKRPAPESPAPERPAPERPAPERPAPERPAPSQAGTPHLASPSSRSEHLETTQDFTYNTILLLLDLTKTHQHVYYRSKPGFYKILQRQFSKEGYSFSSDKIRNLNNLLTTYKRAKDRCTSTGEGNITWEYYGIMDNLFGRCGVGSAPPGTLVSTPLFPTASQPPTTLPCASEGQPGPSMTLPTTQPRSIRSRVSHPSFYDLYEAHSERRTSALETLVRPEQERRRRLKERKRRRFEAKMLTAMGEVVSQLKCIGSQQERIIELLQDKPNMP